MLGHVVEPLATNDQNTLLLQYYIDTLRFRVRVRNAEPVSSSSPTIILLADLFRYFF